MYSKLLIALLISLLNLLLNAQETQKDSINENEISIKVFIKDISTDKGNVYFSLYDSVESFDKKEPLQRITTIVVDGETAVEFTNIKAGTYAVTCFHDSNDNKQLDFEGFIPIEEYAVSNNVMLYAPPYFKQIAFDVTNSDVELKLHFQ